MWKNLLCNPETIHRCRFSVAKLYIVSSPLISVFISQADFVFQVEICCRLCRGRGGAVHFYSLTRSSHLNPLIEGSILGPWVTLLFCARRSLDIRFPCWLAAWKCSGSIVIADLQAIHLFTNHLNWLTLILINRNMKITFNKPKRLYTWSIRRL